MDSIRKQVSVALEVATKELGYKELRPNQEAAIRNFLGGKDVFVSLPTGAGKSLCYSLLPRVYDELRQTPYSSIVIVVSPLIALMKDQVKSMTRRGVRAVYAAELSEEGITEIVEGKQQLIFMSPETLLTNSKWRDIIQSPLFQENLLALVVDEAHCVTKW